MRYSNFVLALVLILPFLILACDENNNSISSTAQIEDDFASNPAMLDNPEKGIVVDFLESATSEDIENDTSEAGIDEIPVRYPRTVEHTLCWEDEDPEAMHFMVLTDSEGSEILTLEANGECATQIIEKGDYLMSIHHDGRTETTFPVFIIPEAEIIEEARKTDVLIDGFKVVIANIVNGIRNTVSKDARAQTGEENINTLIGTNMCPGCVLTKAILVFVNLMHANLSQADLREAILISANLSQADLRGANLSRANLRDARLSEADLSQADFREANLESTDLHFSNLSQADLTSANLSSANLIGANLIGANLVKADLSLATWCHGCICAEGSIGGCNGCPPVEEVCTGP